MIFNKMIKSKKKSIEQSLWDTAIKLRGSVDPGEYKHVVLSLIFLKYIGDVFKSRYEELISEGKKKYVDMVEFYAMKNVFYLPQHCRWDYIIKNAKQKDISVKIDSALKDIEKKNKSLKGALPENYFSRLDIEISKLAALLDTINNIDITSDKSNDIIGRVYEYFLKQFSITEKNMKGEFYTPKCLVNLIAELIEPYRGTIYDPCCGTGGMFVQSMKFIDSHKGNKKDIAIYGQENIATTYKLARMNLAVRGILANLGEGPRDTFTKDQHEDLKADFIMANPPFNLKDWRDENELNDDPRWSGYDIPPVSNANFAWILHIVSKLSTNGTAGFLLANGALSDDDTLSIRKKLIENDLIDAIFTLPRNTFYSTDISVTLWIISKNKKKRILKNPDKTRNLRDRSNEILFMDLRQWGAEIDKRFIEITDEEIKRISSIYHSWQESESFKDINETCKSVKSNELKIKNYSLKCSDYIQFINQDSKINYDKEMKRISKDFSKILENEKESQNKLIEAFKKLGHEIKS